MRLLRLKAALAALLLAPLAGYAIVYLLVGDAGQGMRVMPSGGGESRPEAPSVERGT